MNGTVNLIGSHNNRIQCWLAELKKRQLELEGTFDYQEPEKIRFKNCAILFVKGEGKKLTISMIYEGELGESDESKRQSSDKNRRVKGDKVYYCAPDPVNVKDVPFNQLTYVTDYDYNIEAYIIRHGEGEHNAKVFYKRDEKYDTSLTDAGRTQGKNAAEELLNHLTTKNNSAQSFEPEMIRFFVSDLQRTFQTLLCFDELKSTDKRWYLLPCSHEVTSEKANCDKKESNIIFSKIPNLFAFENTPLWAKLSTNIGAKQINTRKYEEFYPSGFRMGVNFGRQHCRQKNMLQLANEIIKEEEEYHRTTSMMDIGEETQPAKKNQLINEQERRWKEQTTRKKAQEDLMKRQKQRMLEEKTRLSGKEEDYIAMFKNDIEKEQPTQNNGGKKRTRRRKTKKRR